MAVRLWLLKLNEEHQVWDGCTGHVIRATTPNTARQAASYASGDEGAEVWINPKRSTCKHIKVNSVDTATEIILTQTKDG